MDMASNSPVMQALPSKAVMGWCIPFCQRYSPSTAKTTPTSILISAGIPNHQMAKSAAGISAELFPDAAKMKKQMSYANAHNIPFVALIGENELSEGKVTLKDMASGNQTLLTPDELINMIR